MYRIDAIKRQPLYCTTVLTSMKFALVNAVQYFTSDFDTGKSYFIRFYYYYSIPADLHLISWDASLVCSFVNPIGEYDRHRRRAFFLYNNYSPEPSVSVCSEKRICLTATGVFEIQNESNNVSSCVWVPVHGNSNNRNIFFFFSESKFVSWKRVFQKFFYTDFQIGKVIRTTLTLFYALFGMLDCFYEHVGQKKIKPTTDKSRKTREILGTPVFTTKFNLVISCYQHSFSVPFPMHVHVASVYRARYNLTEKSTKTNVTTGRFIHQLKSRVLTRLALACK